jgi:hypothetical protein
MRIERVVLEDHRDVPLSRLEIIDSFSADAYLAGGDVLEPCEHHHCSRLSAARRPDEDEKLAVADLQAQILDRPGPIGVDLADVVEDDRCQCCGDLPVLVVVSVGTVCRAPYGPPPRRTNSSQAAFVWRRGMAGGC